MMKRIAVALLLILVWSPSLWADVVELRSGERVEGALREATPAAVVIDVAGQSIRFEAAKVHAIYYGSPTPAAVKPAPPAATPPPLAPPPAGSALQVLQSMRSAVASGLSLGDYEARVASAAPLVELYLTGSPTTAQSADGLRDAMRYYVLAESAWGNPGLTPRTVWLRKDEALQRCPAYQDFARSMQSKGEAYYSERLRNSVSISDGVISVLWACAADRIAEAEKLALKAKK